jgi:hypothetical protein
MTDALGSDTATKHGEAGSRQRLSYGQPLVPWWLSALMVVVAGQLLRVWTGPQYT